MQSFIGMCSVVLELFNMFNENESVQYVNTLLYTGNVAN